jgi:CheY-like chemotaxis protein
MTPNANGTLVEILLVEDDPADVQLVKEALQEGQVPYQVSVVNDGVQAMAYLRGEDPYGQAILPDLILLDLKMPRMSGLEVLAEIKRDDLMRSIPVIVLTTSDAPDDILKAYALQASMYITKPEDLEEFDRIMNTIRDLFLTVVKLPPRD